VIWHRRRAQRSAFPISTYICAPYADCVQQNAARAKQEDLERRIALLEQQADELRSKEVQLKAANKVRSRQCMTGFLAYVTFRRCAKSSVKCNPPQRFSRGNAILGSDIGLAACLGPTAPARPAQCLLHYRLLMPVYMPRSLASTRPAQVRHHSLRPVAQREAKGRKTLT
jgi:hypothetical protein